MPTNKYKKIGKKNKKKNKRKGKWKNEKKKWNWNKVKVSNEYYVITVNCYSINKLESKLENLFCLMTVKIQILKCTYSIVITNTYLTFQSALILPCFWNNNSWYKNILLKNVDFDF